MKRLYCLLAVLAGLALVSLLLWLGTAAAATPPPAPTTRYVANDGVDGGDCSTVVGRCETIQYAVDVSDPGAQDVIRVAAGTYTGPSGTVAVITRSVQIIGAFAPGFPEPNPDPDLYETVLDGQWGGSVISVTNAQGVVLLHLTLIRGDGSGNNCTSGAGGCGGGLYAKHTDIYVGGCVVKENVGSSTGDGQGGGIYVENYNAPVPRPAQIWDSTFLSNTASTFSTGWGGGLYVNESQAVTITGNTFEFNVACISGSVVGLGGGAYLDIYATPVTLRDNLFRHNYASRATSAFGRGGALALWERGWVLADGNRFLANVASEFVPGTGGAISVGSGAALTMTNNLVAGNDAAYAGGLWLDGYSGHEIEAVLVNNSLVNNNAGTGGEGVWLNSHTTLVLTNTLLAGHTVGITNANPASSTVQAAHNLFYNEADPIVGSNAILDDPKLTADYHLGGGSPGVNAGVDIPWLTVDLDGEPRPQDGAYDVGAFEGVVWEVYMPLVLRSYE